MSKILLIGWNGYKNLGDDVMTQALIHGFKNHQLYLLSSDTEEIFSGDYTIEPFRFRSLQKVSQTIFLLINYLHILRLRNIDVIVVGGGNLFKGTGILRALYFVKKWCSTPVWFLGVGFPDEITHLNKLLSGLQPEAVYVRDTRSLNNLNSFDFPVILMPDLAYGLYKSELYDEDTSTTNIMVVPRAGHTSMAWINGALAKAKANDKGTVTCYPFCLGDIDNDLQWSIEFLRDLVPVTDEGSIYSIERRIDSFVSNSALVETIRLHGMILAIIFGKPFTFESYHHKCLDHFNTWCTNAQLMKTTMGEYYVVPKDDVEYMAERVKCILAYVSSSI